RGLVRRWIPLDTKADPAIGFGQRGNFRTILRTRAAPFGLTIRNAQHLVTEVHRERVLERAREILDVLRARGSAAVPDLEQDASRLTDTLPPGRRGVDVERLEPEPFEIAPAAGQLRGERRSVTTAAHADPHRIERQLHRHALRPRQHAQTTEI